MRRACLFLLSLPFLFLAGPTAHAGGKPADAPAIVVRVSSLNVLIKNLTLVTKLVGQEEAAAQIEGLIKSKIGKNGIEGIDPARPFGAYVRFGKAIDDVSGAVLIPITDEKSFLELLDNVGVTYAKGKDGVYTHKTNKNVAVYFRFANKYLYATSLNPASIQGKTLPDPTAALAVSTDAAIAIVARIDQIPNDAKLIALAQLDAALAAALEKAPPNETKTQAAFRVALLREVGKFGGSLIRDSAEARFDLNLSEKSKDLTVNVVLTAKPGTGLATSIKSLGALKSPLASLPGTDLAFRGGLHLALPDDVNKALGQALDDAAKQALAGIQNEQKKAQAKALFDALLPTAKGGELQIVTAVFGPKQGRFAFLGALKVKDGLKLGKTATDLIKDALNDIPPAERAKIQLDFDSVGATKIHKFQLPKDAKTEAFLEQIAGDNHLYLAFRDDAVFVALGKDALAGLKAALGNSASAASTPLVFDFDVARMAKLMAKSPEQLDLAKKLFPAGETGRVRLTVEGGTTLAARLQIQLNVLEFLMKLQNDKGQ